MLLRAHKSLLNSKDLLEFLPRVIKGEESMLDVENGSEKDFVELGCSWRAPFYEITLCFRKPYGQGNEEGKIIIRNVFFLMIVFVVTRYIIEAGVPSLWCLRFLPCPKDIYSTI